MSVISLHLRMEDFLVDIPTQISIREPVFGLDFHPKRNLIAYSTAAGTIQIQQYQPNGPNTLQMNLTHHTKSCRSVSFSSGDGVNLFSCSNDKSIVGVDIETRQTIFDQKKAHKSAINAMLVHQNLIFTGDEDGVVKIWDQRKPDKVKEIAEHEDYVSGFALNEDRNTLLATSADQTLTVMDFASGKALDRSTEMDDELLSVAVIKGGRKVVCGGQNGLISIFSWDQWADRSSVCPGHLESVDCMVPVDENTIITGCGDGIIRIVSILPNKILGVISAQSEELPITNLSVSHDKTYLAACVDNTVQFWNVSMLYNDDEENEPGAEEEDLVEEAGEDEVLEGVEDELDEDGEEEEEGELSFEDELTPSSDDSSDESSSSESPQKPVPQMGKKGKKFDAEKAAFFGDL